MKRLSLPSLRSIVTLPRLMLLLVAAVYALLPLLVTRTGDDVFYTLALRGTSFTDWFLSHFPRNYGRFMDLLAPLALGLPRPLFGILNGAVTALFYLLILRASRVPLSRTLPALTVMFLTTFTLGWEYLWNESLLFVNYVWSAALNLGVILLAAGGDIRRAPWWYWLTLPLCFLGGSAHEGISVMMLVAIPLYLALILPHHRMAAARLLMLLCVWGGAIYTLSAPSYYDPQPVHNNFTAAQILFCSGCWCIVLLLLVVLLRLRRPAMLRRLLGTPWSIYCIGAVAGVALALAAGFPGRPAWFGGIYALVGVAGIPAWRGIPFPRALRCPAAWLLALLLTIHFGGVIIWQAKLGHESRSMVRLYKESTDGVIWLDHTADSEIPEMLRGLVHGIPDADNAFYRRSMATGYGTWGSMPLIVAPAAAESLKYQDIKRPVLIGRYIISISPLSGTRTLATPSGLVRVADVGGVRYVELPLPLRTTRPGRSNAPVALLYEPVCWLPGEWI